MIINHRIELSWATKNFEFISQISSEDIMKAITACEEEEETRTKRDEDKITESKGSSKVATAIKDHEEEDRW